MAALPYAALPAFYAGLGESVVERALAFTILTAARTQETLLARWTEIDLTRAVWTISKERMKADREHVVPLSRAAIELLTALPREPGTPYVFIGPRRGAPLSPNAMINHLRRQGHTFTTHGFRASFKTWASEQTAFPPDVVESSLAHSLGNAVERTYNRGQLIERRRPLMESWAVFVVGKAEKGGKVIPLHEARA
jgi:integrase